MKEVDLERRIARMEAIHDVGQLVAQYALGADRRNDPAVMAPLFCSDAVWEASGFGRFEGRPAIVDHLARIGAEQIVWSLHYMISPLIRLDPEFGTGSCQWYLWELAKINQEQGAPASHWIGGWYDSRVAYLEGRWRFQHIILELRLMHKNDEDWSPIFSLNSPMRI